MNRRFDLRQPRWTAGVAAFLFGLAAHLFGLITILHNNDDIGQLPAGYGTGITSGRWLLSLLGDLALKLELGDNLHMVNGVVFLLLIAICAVITVDILSIQSRSMGALTGMLFAVFPSVAATMFFRYTVIYYGIAMVLAVGAVWLKERVHWGGILAVVCIAMSMGIYQAYVPFTISLFVLLLLQQVLQGEENVAAIVKRGIYDCLILGLGVVLYFLCLKICLKLYGTQLSDYNGVNEMGQLTLSQIPALLKKTLYHFVMLPVRNYSGLANMKLIRVAYILLGLYAVIITGWVLICKVKKLIPILLAAALCVLLPFALNFIQIMCPNGWIYTLMLYPMVLIGCVPVVIWEALPRGGGERNLLGKILAVLLAALVFLYAYDTNGNYSALYYSNRQTENYLNSMVTQIRMTEGFDAGKKWAFIGYIQDPMFRSPWLYESVYGGNENSELLVNRPTRWHWFQMYCGITVQIIPEQEAMEIAKTEAVRQMPCWPAEGSIQVLDDVVVIKLQELEDIRQ